MQDEAKKYSDIVNNLLKFIYPEIDENVDSVKGILNEYGYDYDEVSKKGLEFIIDLERKQLSKIAAVKRNRLTKMLADFQHNIKNEVKEPFLKTLKDLISSEDSELQLAFHKLESLSEDDLKNILNDVQFLKMLNNKNRNSESTSSKNNE